MATVAEILAENGVKFEAFTSGRQTLPLVRKVYDALNDGAEYVYVFGSEASEDMLSLVASAEDVESGNALVLHNSEYDAMQLQRKINYVNALNVNSKTGKPRAKHTLGSVTVSQRTTDGSGFIVRAA
jgi:hypothetical protein